MNAAIEERVGGFVQGLVPGLSLDRVTVDHDVASGVTTVTVAGRYTFRRLWDIGPDDPEAVEESVDAKLETDRYEVAVALDISSSMLRSMPSGTPGVDIVKMEGLKNAMGSVLTVVEEASQNDPGSIMVSMVPFGVAVNVADTCNPDPDSGLCRPDHSLAKERYVRMLAGPHATTAATLAAARTGGRHWVDTFHHYGAGSNLGPLWARSLPQDLLDARDWDLRREDVEVDVSAVAPNLDTGADPGIWVVGRRGLLERLRHGALGRVLGCAGASPRLVRGCRGCQLANHPGRPRLVAGRGGPARRHAVALLRRCAGRLRIPTRFSPPIPTRTPGSAAPRTTACRA